ncbi:hypothetical protein M441DRAFT_421281 [Trichoderma asperellum CBS 433.97]|uniref:Secreted protein n=1 Tax=Trichoderma asperellum (strain ATCC 204424 / CBS 433.97 / NBRC 101777) TaxID=1042311 RepID=A0A2T3Z538_TRIA4|nr:hypothetical protein M441DRAFT_421281 [Trichoderma asperellum CBS 433.97]PTB39860.1 hypothetical protein M441DRAFT_421281 [Trichoderma asperellum CBS 433.97]
MLFRFSGFSCAPLCHLTLPSLLAATPQWGMTCPCTLTPSNGTGSSLRLDVPLATIRKPMCPVCKHGWPPDSRHQLDRAIPASGSPHCKLGLPSNLIVRLGNPSISPMS